MLPVPVMKVSLTKAKIKAFVEYSLIWYSEQFAVPFWDVGHVHLHVTDYHADVEALASIGLHLMVALGFWLGFRKSQRPDDPDDPDDRFLISDNSDPKNTKTTKTVRSPHLWRPCRFGPWSSEAPGITEALQQERSKKKKPKTVPEPGAHSSK